jgi:NAD-dependent deacetylase
MTARRRWEAPHVHDRALQDSALRLRAAHDVVVFTGAGVSAESGIPTFRDDDGLWQQFPPEAFATWQGLLRVAATRPRVLAAFLHAVLGSIARAEPNAAHVALARLEQHAAVTVVTQNVDRLHQDAGSTVVLEVHGSLLEVVTRRGRFVRLLSRAELRRTADRLERASRSLLAWVPAGFALRRLAGLSWRGIVRPRVVLFGDALLEPEWSTAQRAARACDLMLVVGTSGLVMPAAMLPHEAKAAGATIITVDPHEPGMGDVWLRGTAVEVVPMLVAEAFGRD